MLTHFGGGFCRGTETGPRLEPEAPAPGAELGTRGQAQALGSKIICNFLETHFCAACANFAAVVAGAASQEPLVDKRWRRTVQRALRKMGTNFKNYFKFNSLQ